MAWSVAPSLSTMFAEANRLWPDRSKASDGTIGDAAHSARTSDHNPGARNLVHAADLTHDPAHGVDCAWLSALLYKRVMSGEEKRVKTLIFDRRIFTPSVSGSWRPYTGSNAHRHHMHVSIYSTVDAENDRSPWFVNTTPAPPRSAFTTLYRHEDDMALTLDHTEPLDSSGNAQWFTDRQWSDFISVEACHPVRPVVDGRYEPGLAAQPVEHDGRIIVVITGGKPSGSARVMLTVSE